MKPTAEGAAPDRGALRSRLLAERDRLAASLEAASIAADLGAHLCRLLAQLEPTALGLYWPMRLEFNAAAAIAADTALANRPSALPFACKSPIRMEYRAWDGQAPRLEDECGIPSSDGPAVVPDVVVVPCVGFTPEGYRLGYGGGYFDRWLASHPEVTAIGIAGSFAEIPHGDFRPLAHDVPLMLVVTERGVFGS